VNLPPLIDAATDLIQRVNAQSNRGKYVLGDVAQATASIHFLHLCLHAAAMTHDDAVKERAFGVGVRASPVDSSQDAIPNTGIRRFVDAVITLIATPSVTATNYDLILEG
jgi:hypothetical protein